MAQKPKATVVTTERRFGKRTKLVVLAAAVLVVLGVVAWIWEPWHRSSPAKPTVPTKAYQAQVNQLSVDAEKGQNDKAISQINDELSQQNVTVSQKVGLLEQEAGAYVHKGDNKEALTIYQQSESLQKGTLDTATSQGLMYLYYSMGNKAQAANYARKLIAAVRATNDPTAKMVIPQYENFIKSLGYKP